MNLKQKTIKSFIPKKPNFVRLFVLFGLLFFGGLLFFSQAQKANASETPIDTLIGTNFDSSAQDAYNAGFSFTPQTNGQITSFWYRTAEANVATIRLYDQDDSGNELFSDVVNASGESTWVELVLGSPISLSSGHNYVVSVLNSKSWVTYYEFGDVLPQTVGNIVINESRYDAAETMPTQTNGITIMGIVDFTFVADAAADFTSTHSGDWNIGTTWGGACTSSCVAGTDYPDSTKTAIIANGHTVTLTGAGAALTITINSGGTLYLGSNTLTLSGTGTPLTMNGTFTAGAGTVAYNSASGVTNLASVAMTNSNAFYNLTFNGSGTFNAAYDFEVGHTFTVGSGTTFAGPSTNVVMNNGSSISNSGTLNFYNLIINTNSSVTSSGNFSVASTFSILSGGIFTPAAADIITGSGASITGSGTVKVTRTAATATFNSQYVFTSFVLSSLTVDYTASGQVLSNLTYGNLKVSGSITGSGNYATVNTNFNVTGTFTPTSGFIALGNGGTITNSGTLTFYDLSSVVSGSSFSTSSSFSIAGTLTVGATATFTASAGTITLNNGAIIAANAGTRLFNNLTIPNSVTANTSYTVAGALTVGASGTLNPSTGTVTLNSGASLSNAGTLSFQNLTIASGTSTGNTTYIIKGVLTNSSGGTFTSNSGTVTMNDGASIVNSGNQLTFNNLTVADSATLTANTSYTVAGALTVGTGANLAPTSGTITLSGTGTPLSISGTFTTSGTNTVAYTGSTANVTARTFQNLTLGGSGTYTMPASTLTLNGNLVVTSGATVTKGAGVVVFAGSSTQTITDSNGTKQDLGSLQVSNTAVVLGSSIKATSLTIDSAKQLDANGSNTLTLTGNGSSVLVATGTFVPSTGTVDFTSGATSGTTVPALTYNNLTLNKASNTFTAGGNIIANNFTLTAGTFIAPTTLTVNGDFSNSGTFTHNSGTVVIAPTAVNGISNILGSSSTTFNNLTNTTTGSTIQFKNGNTYTFSGVFTATGNDSVPISLFSDSPGSQWTVTFNSTPSFSFVRVRDSACSGGSTLSQNSQLFNLGNNGSCWGFIVRSGGGSSDAAGTSNSSAGGGGSGGGSGSSGGGGGSGSSSSCTATATGTAELEDGVPGFQSVVAVNIVCGGSGYTVAPTITFSGGGGSGAAATAVLTNGVVTSVNIDVVGGGYSTAPTVTFTAGGQGGGGGGPSP